MLSNYQTIYGKSSSRNIDNYKPLNCLLAQEYKNDLQKKSKVLVSCVNIYINSILIRNSKIKKISMRYVTYRLKEMLAVNIHYASR
jgi:hypothetical protein